MIDSFVRSLLSGKLFSGPMAVFNGWNEVYDVSLPQIGLAVRDAPDYTPPVTPNRVVYNELLKVVKRWKIYPNLNHAKSSSGDSGFGSSHFARISSTKRVGWVQRAVRPCVEPELTDDILTSMLDVAVIRSIP
jgi:hypothetical protein